MRQDLKVILMSATIDTNRFTAYFQHLSCNQGSCTCSNKAINSGELYGPWTSDVVDKVHFLAGLSYF